MTNELIEKEVKTIELLDPNTSKTEQLELEVEEVKAGLQNIAEVGEKAITQLAELARSSQHPRLYEALANSIKAVNETHRELNNILRTKAELLENSKKGGDKVIEDNRTVNNNLYVSSTELLQMIKDKAKNG